MPDYEIIAPWFFGGLLVGILGTILSRPSIARRLRYVPPLGAINFNQGNL